MSTPAQAAANLANAQNSTGPRTETGKAASSQNALKHGLNAKTVLLPGEDEAAYRAMCEGMFASFAPVATPEKELVQQLCDTQWRLHRCGRLEAAVLSAEVPDFKTIDIISRNEARLKKQYSTTLKEAQTLIDARLAQMKEATLIRRADLADNCSTDINEIGFVFSVEQVDAAILREDTLTVARQILRESRRRSTGYDLESDSGKESR